jgi:hypothetical protein
MDPRLPLSVLSSAAELFAVVQFTRCGAHRSYPWFIAFLLAGAAQTFIWLAGSPDSHSYLVAYRLTMPLMLGLQYLVVIELWRRLMSCYLGIHRVSNLLGIAILLIAAAISASTGFDGLHLWGKPLGSFGFLWLMWGIRYTASVLCIFSALLALWAGAFDHGVPANTIRHAWLLACYFGSVALGYLVVNLVKGSALIAGVILTGSSIAFYTLWGRLITREGEAPTERLIAPRRSLMNVLPWPIRRMLPY